MQKNSFYISLLVIIISVFSLSCLKNVYEVRYLENKIVSNKPHLVLNGNYLIQKVNNSVTDGYVINSGELQISDDSSKAIIKSYAELKEFVDKYNNYSYDSDGNDSTGTLDELLSKYNQDYFTSKILALQYVELTRGSDYVEYKGYQLKDNSIEIEYEIVKSEIGSTVISGNLIVVELDRNVIEQNAEIKQEVDVKTETEIKQEVKTEQQVENPDTSSNQVQVFTILILSVSAVVITVLTRKNIIFKI